MKSRRGNWRPFAWTLRRRSGSRSARSPRVRPDSKQEQRCGMKTFDYLEPASAAEACRMLADAGPNARPLAGGTDLLIQMEMGKVIPETLVYLGRAEDLARI